MITSKRILMAIIFAFFVMALATPRPPIAIRDLATTISKDLGKLGQTYESNKGQILIFEEKHTSRIGQIQIAHMIVRLHNNYSLKAVALEGAFPSDGPLKANWVKKMDDNGRLQVAARLLSEGETSSAEFIAVGFPDINVIGVDDPVRYKVELDDKSGTAGTMYLLKIAEGKVTEYQAEKFQKLINEKRIIEAIKLIVGADPWTKQKYAQMSQECQTISAEDMIRYLKEIESEASSRSISIEYELSSGMKNLQQFFQAASERSDIIVKETLAVARANPDTPVALIIGAAHTARVVDLLRKANYSFAVVTPLALAECDTTGDLDGDAYKRKTRLQSVDAQDGVGAILDARKKPRTVINEVWLESKANLYYAVSTIAQAAAKGEKPPFKSVSNLNLLEGVRIDGTKVKIDGDEVIFQTQIQDKNGKWNTLWIRAAYKENVAIDEEKSPIEKHIEKLLIEAGGGGGGIINTRRGTTTQEPEDKGQGKKQKPKARKGAKLISQGVYGIISKDRAAVQAPIFGS